ncbi:aminotransferase [Microbacterium rhizosphaerae]|uniref:Aminotransferase n=1 Tax=Microbacterium rhizosphaerae TaxID=1678237 RepID=A0ABZ0SKD6_9MICO|nr:aminotransferase [Microbacterium rhizosphaerae]WPR88640.1 aminotransferase [Microbacterium rhizosphaerae]
MPETESLVQAPPPEISPDEAADLAAALFGVTGSARPLGSNQDLNFVIDDGVAPRLLKIANPATPAAELEAQSRAAARIAERSDVRVPMPHVFDDGTSVRAVELEGGIAHARLLDFLPGRTLSGSRYLSPAAIRAMGRLAASVDLALAGFADPGAERTNQWDLQHAPAALAALLPSVADTALRARLRSTAESAWRAVAVHAESLPQQVIHGDLTDDNVVTTDGRVPDGVIDLGDLGRTWRVGELAITLSSLLHHDGVDLPAALEAVRAYHEVLPLADAELDVLWPLLALRAAVLVASAHHILLTDPGNEYAAENLAHEELIFEAAVSLPLPVATELVRHAVGADAPPLRTPSGRLIRPRSTPGLLDLSVDSALLDEGRWLDPDAESELLRAATAEHPVATRFGEPRLTRSRPYAHDGPANVPLGLDFAVPEPVALQAPWDGVVDLSGDLVAGGLRLRLRGASDVVAGPVREGEVFAEVVDVVTISLVADGVDVPEFTTAALAPAWRPFVADPSPLLGLPPAAIRTSDAGRLLHRREEHVAEVQEHYFDEPPVMLRGWRELLVDEDGRVYVDALNNVTSIGHAHPLLVHNIARQWSLLNTNSRFHYPQIAEFAERLAGLLPDGLDQVFLVNSGSEAVDLALRLAQAHTGRKDVVAVREAYHGWTYLTDAVSTSVADNPSALETRPEWVHTVDAPNPFRGVHRDDPSRYAVDAVAEVERLADAGTPPGAFLAETLYGNAGGVALPAGYLEAVYAAVRAHGGVAVADEVQVGYGRLGHWFWGFEQQGVVPDIVAVAKAMGNGHPLGAVITTPEIAASYRSQGYFFSSAGGSPVSSVVGLTVLDVIQSEGLQQNAAEVGGYLKERLQELGTRHPLLATVHGFGFYLGPEFAREDGAPATEETAAICDRMRRLGVIIQPTGDFQNVLKVKPPMVFTRESADAFVDALDRVLSTGW